MANVLHIVYEYSIYSHQAINSVEHREYELLNLITLAQQLRTARETINNAVKRLCKIVNTLHIRVQTVKNIQYVMLIVTLLYLAQRSVGKQIEELCHF
jgi:transcription initiation factor TFIIIB Brf1 subunit/transcription initiation factor TFIIB